MKQDEDFSIDDSNCTFTQIQKKFDDSADSDDSNKMEGAKE